ncbi:hypothetical protein GDO86_009050 [Hymenochirus boettgeri]|uniref:Uncharacterized protein n=1 Tax=Hymenochirus boettgeri TaxID=247094 RepID=A0A8T2JJ70_9PIPI|nr:hypothetical protein GDO86_009050 [Hymenochirus boettgeri]
MIGYTWLFGLQSINTIVVGKKKSYFLHYSYILLNMADVLVSLTCFNCLIGPELELSCGTAGAIDSTPTTTFYKARQQPMERQQTRSP